MRVLSDLPLEHWSRSISLSWGTACSLDQLFYLLLVLGALEQVHISQLGNSLQFGPA